MYAQALVHGSQKMKMNIPFTKNKDDLHTLRS